MTEEIANTLKLDPQAGEGNLAYLELNGIGPAKQLSFTPNRRLNIITGDNGFGKTFLLECAWWALSGIRPENPVYPGDDSGINDATISFQLMTKSSRAGKTETLSYDWEKQQWPAADQRTRSPGLVIYARIDGSSVQRIISLAYLLLWTWEEHKIACQNWILSYCKGEITFNFLKKAAPFIAHELERKGLKKKVTQMMKYPSKARKLH